MSDISYWYDEYNKEVDQFILFVAKLQNLVDSSNLKAIESCVQECETKLVRVKEVKKSFGLELRLVRDRNEKADFEQKSKLLEEKCNNMTQILNQTKASNGRKDLFKESAGRNAYSTEGKDNDALLGEAHKIQDLTFDSLGRTKNMIIASREIGGATLEQLRGQHEQIIDIENEIDKLDSHLVRAEKLVMNFSKRMATDRIIQGFAAVNIVVMLSLVLYVVISGKSLSPTTSKDKKYVGPPVSVTPTFSPTLGVNETYSPTRFPTFKPTPLPTYIPSFMPSQAPTETPTNAPSYSSIPTAAFPPTSRPSHTPMPSARPTVTPSEMPSPVPSTLPSAAPSADPSVQPSALPSMIPTVIPTAMPSIAPSVQPTVLPSEVPSASPTAVPSASPSVTPTQTPSTVPSPDPSVGPTASPTYSPSATPTDSPTP